MSQSFFLNSTFNFGFEFFFCSLKFHGMHSNISYSKNFLQELIILILLMLWINSSDEEINFSLKPDSGVLKSKY